MTIVEYEPDSIDLSICYNSSTDTLVIPENIVKELEATYVNGQSDSLLKILTELESSTDLKYQKLNEYLGLIGLQELLVINKGSNINGLC